MFDEHVLVLATCNSCLWEIKGTGVQYIIVLNNQYILSCMTKPETRNHVAADHSFSDLYARWRDEH